MFLYNWNALYSAAKGDCKTILRFIKILKGHIFPTFKDSKALATLANKNKNSFILDIEGVIFDKVATDMDKCVYLALAAKRNYVQYKQFGIDYIDTYIVEDAFDIEKLKQNALLTIKDDRIYFKY